MRECESERAEEVGREKESVREGARISKREREKKSEWELEQDSCLPAVPVGGSICRLNTHGKV